LDAAESLLDGADADNSLHRACRGPTCENYVKAAIPSRAESYCSKWGISRDQRKEKNKAVAKAHLCI
jgi:hypothetical protein